MFLGGTLCYRAILVARHLLKCSIRCSKSCFCFTSSAFRWSCRASCDAHSLCYITSLLTRGRKASADSPSARAVRKVMVLLAILMWVAMDVIGDECEW
jgi:hypothetical protein